MFNENGSLSKYENYKRWINEKVSLKNYLKIFYISFFLSPREQFIDGKDVILFKGTGNK